MRKSQLNKDVVTLGMLSLSTDRRAEGQAGRPEDRQTNR